MAMRVSVLGAAGGVTGSMYLVEGGGARVLVDCGLFQGGAEEEQRNVIPEGLKPERLDAVVLTHAHLDHCGRLPLLVKRGFEGPIFVTAATGEMASLVLHDAAHVQKSDAERENRRRMRAGKTPIAPLFDERDVDRTVERFEEVEYGADFVAGRGLEVELIEAGHMLGSASVVMRMGDGRRVVFSGDLGPRGLPFLRERVGPKAARVVFLESTYGDRNHRSPSETLEEFRGILRSVVSDRLRVLVPVFAVGRSQQILYHLERFFQEGEVEEFEVFLDSPMAMEATEITLRHPELFNEEARKLQEAGGLLNNPRWLKVCPRAEDSRALNEKGGPCMILAGAGMCTGGRILHHLKHGLWRKDTAVVFVGYQAQGTLGRSLVDGAERVRVLGEEIQVRARVLTLGGLSAHAGQRELLEWLAPLAEWRPVVVLTHGEEVARRALGERILALYGIRAELPGYGDVVDWDGIVRAGRC